MVKCNADIGTPFRGSISSSTLDTMKEGAAVGTTFLALFVLCTSISSDCPLNFELDFLDI